MAIVSIPRTVARELYRESGASTWGLSVDVFVERLTVSASARFKSDASAASTADVERFLRSLHLADLALACACGAGHEDAWEHFVREMRPALYAAARSMAPPDVARDLADSLYARLLGVDARGERRTSLLDYYHGRARLTTWLRTVLAQRYVDDLRRSARTVSLDDLDVPDRAAESTPIDPRAPERAAHVQRALSASIAALDVRDRLRLRLYYGQGLKLAAIGRLTGESEATVSRKLDRARQAIRQGVEAQLRAAPGMTDEAIAACLADAAASAELDVSPLLASDDG